MKMRASLISLAVAIVALVLVARQLDWRGVAEAWSHMLWPWLVVAALVNVTNTWIEGLRWRTILDASEIKVSPTLAFASMLIGTVGNVFLPLKLGEAARGWALSRLTGSSVTTVLSTVVLDRVVDGVAVVPLLIAVAVIGSPGLKLPGLRAITIGMAVAAVVIGVGVLAWNQLRRRHSTASGSRLAPHLEAFGQGLRTLRQHHDLAKALTFGVLSWCTRVAVVWCMFPAFRLAWSPVRAAVTLIGLNLSIIAVATPGNVGTFELAGSGLVHYFGAPPEIAVSYAVALHIAEVVPTVLLGAFAIWRLGLRFDRQDIAEIGTKRESNQC